MVREWSGMALMLGVLIFGAVLWLLLLLKSFLQSYLHADGHRARKVHMGDAAGVASIQGMRAHMEDTYQAACAVNGDSQRAFYGVYDGHGGYRASEFTAEHLHEFILKDKFVDEPIKALKNGFRQCDADWLAIATKNNYDDGTTAISVLIVNHTIYVANVGDSRAVLCHHGKAIDMSSDHKPIREDEKQRIEALGGRIFYFGTWRVEGVLAVTRAIGDRRLKKYVSAVPEIKHKVLEKGDDYLILASDGVWDVLSSQDSCQIVNGLDDMHAAARKLTDTAYRSGSMDNITSLVIDLRKYQQPQSSSSSKRS